MKIKKLKIRNFRNIEDLEIMPTGVLNAFWGMNGQGKTNVLEAIFSAIKGESFRPYCNKKDWRPNEIESSEGSRVHLVLEDAKGFQSEVLLLYGEKGRWEIFFNGKKSRFSSVRTKIPVVVFSPDDHSLIRGAPDGRRNYIDELFSDTAPGYGEVLSRFNRALKQRNQVLRALRKAENYDQKPLLSWTKLLAQEAFELWTIREELWPDLRRCFLEVCEDIFGQKLQNIEIKYLFDLEKGSDEWKVDEIFQHMIGDHRKDIATGWTHRGPQRDDFLILLKKDSPARTQASQSQARMLALALKWTHAEFLKRLRNEPAIFVIDDLSSELDAKHRELLFSRIIKHSGQIFLSGTEHSLVDLKDFSDYNYWTVREGSLNQIPHGKYSRSSQEQAVL